jgi:hypothetical protein
MGELNGVAQIGGHTPTLNGWATLSLNSAGGNVGIGTTNPATKLHVSDSILAGNGLAQGYHVPSPGGGQYVCQTATVNGYLKVTLPQSWTATMMRMTVDVYEYSTGVSRTINLGGYNYSASSWINTFASQVCSDTTPIRVDFGHDGTYCALYISKGTSGASSSWTYPQVLVRDFFAGYSGYTVTNWDNGWSVGYTTSLGTITSVLTANPTGCYQ